MNSVNLNSPYRLITLAIVLAIIAGAAINLASVYGFPVTGYAAAGAGFVYINVSCTTSITLVNSTVTFGPMLSGTTNDTTDNFPPPLYVRNDGNVPVNISIRSTNLFVSLPNPNLFFEYKCANTTEWTCRCTLGLTTTDAGCNITTNTNTWAANGTGQNGSQFVFTPIPASDLVASMVQYNLSFNDTNDELEIDINVSIPGNESAGTKEANVTVVAKSTQPVAECV